MGTYFHLCIFGLPPSRDLRRIEILRRMPAKSVQDALPLRVLGRPPLLCH